MVLEIERYVSRVVCVRFAGRQIRSMKKRIFSN
jgi:hypothetical protein